MNSKAKGKLPLPTFHTDEEAEEFVAHADLTDYDLSAFKPMRFEFAPEPTDDMETFCHRIMRTFFLDRSYALRVLRLQFCYR